MEDKLSYTEEKIYEIVEDFRKTLDTKGRNYLQSLDRVFVLEENFSKKTKWDYTNIRHRIFLDSISDDFEDRYNLIFFVDRELDLLHVRKLSDNGRRNNS